MVNYPTSIHLVAYNTELRMPDVKGKVVLELPCGMGVYVRKHFKHGAARVIASDIVPLQLEISREKDREAGIPEGVVEYYAHDARIPKQLSTVLADACSAIHLFSFAENESELRGMARMLFINLKRGAHCIIIISSLCNDESKIRYGFENGGEKIELLDLSSYSKFQPRKLHTSIKGFHFNQYVWPHETVCEVLKDEGFTRTEVVPYKVDPSYRGELDVQGYADAINGNVILAWK